MLYGSVVTPSDLFQVGDSIVKGMVAGGDLEKSEVKVNFGSCDHCNAPLDIMVPGKMVEMVQGLNREEAQGAG